MEISKNKQDWIKAGIIALIITLVFACSMFPFYYGIFIGAFAAFFSLIRKENKEVNERKEKITNIVLLVITPFLVFSLTELLNENGISVYHYPINLLVNLFFFYTIELLLFFSTKKSSLTITIYTLFFFVLALINSYVVSFRGYGLSMSDFYSVETAINMAGEYSYQLNETQLLATLIILFYIYFVNNHTLTFDSKKLKVIGSSITVVALAVFIVLSSCTPFLTNITVVPKFYYDHPNGFYINLLGQIQVLNEDRTPEGYSVDVVKDVLSKIEKTESSQIEKPVNIICIMNEALTDLTIYENFDVGYDPLEYIHSLKEDTITGYTYTSVYGGTTVISEYEFLSNTSALFFGSTMSPYSTFVDENSHSLVKQLKEEGYYATSIHPYKKISYNRPYAYGCLGFEEQWYEQDLLERELYYTDSGLYKIIEEFTEREENQFIFAVTVQNHSPFTLMDEVGLDFDASKYGEKAGKYIALVRESDKAFKELIEYYSNCDEPTIILMFGDHQPKLDSEFFEDVAGKTLKELLTDSNQEIYKTPFIIWANYDIEEKTDVHISVNYLSNFLLENAGIEKTAYQHYLTSIMHELPVITSNGIIDKNGNTYKTIDDLPEELYALAHGYQLLQHNLVYDKENVIKEIFESIR